jgi:pyruvate kinase
MVLAVPAQSPPQIISHVSTAQAIANYDEILDATDAVLISRAYMGMRIPAAKVSAVQCGVARWWRQCGERAIRNRGSCALRVRLVVLGT